MMIISLDIDGTLEVGDPAGSVSIEEVKGLRDMNAIIGSCSSNPIHEQEETWREIGIEPDFMVTKDYLNIVKKFYPNADIFYHFGDLIGLDDVVAEQAGFTFINVNC